MLTPLQGLFFVVGIVTISIGIAFLIEYIFPSKDSENGMYAYLPKEIYDRLVELATDANGNKRAIYMVIEDLLNK